MDRTSETVIELNENSPDKPHNGSPIDMLVISPSGKYFVTYSEKDKSFVGWYIKNDTGKKEGKDIKEDKCVKRMCVSDNKILAYIDDGHRISK